MRSDGNRTVFARIAFSREMMNDSSDESFPDVGVVGVTCKPSNRLNRTLSQNGFSRRHTLAMMLIREPS